jgi:hypothetical protein
LAAQMIKQIAMLFPGCPASEVADIAEHTARRGRGRVGRTEAGRNLEESALTLAVVAAIRHKHIVGACGVTTTMAPKSHPCGGARKRTRCH